MACPKGKGGKKGRSGRKSFRAEFDARKMLDASADVLHVAITAERTKVTPSEKQRQHLATEVFKKLAPSKIEVDGKMEHTGIIFQRPNGTVVKL